MIMKLTEAEAGQISGGQLELHMELLTEKDRVLIVQAMRRVFLDLGMAEVDGEAVDLLMKLADPRIAIWLQHSEAP